MGAEPDPSKGLLTYVFPSGTGMGAVGATGCPLEARAFWSNVGSQAGSVNFTGFSGYFWSWCLQVLPVSPLPLCSQQHYWKEMSGGCFLKSDEVCWGCQLEFNLALCNYWRKPPNCLFSCSQANANQKWYLINLLKHLPWRTKLINWMKSIAGGDDSCESLGFILPSLSSC